MINCEEKNPNPNLERQLLASSAVDRVRMIVDHFGAGSVTVLTSFGVQSGIMLSLGMYARTRYVHISVELFMI